MHGEARSGLQLKIRKRLLTAAVFLPVIIFALAFTSLAFVETEMTYAQLGGANTNVPPTNFQNAFNNNANVTTQKPTTTATANTARSPNCHGDNKSHGNYPNN